MPGQQSALKQPGDGVGRYTDQRVDEDGEDDDVGAQKLARIHRQKADAGIGADGFGERDAERDQKDLFRLADTKPDDDQRQQRQERDRPDPLDAAVE